MSINKNNMGFITRVKIVLHEVLLWQSPADKILSNYFRMNKALGANARFIIAETVYTFLRNYFKLTQKFNNNSSVKPNLNNNSFEKSDETHFNETPPDETRFNKARLDETLLDETRLYESHFDEIIKIIWANLLPLTPVQLEFIAKYKIENYANFEFSNDLLSQTELPQWVLDSLARHYSTEQIIAIGKSLGQMALLDLRVNILKNNRKEVLAQLQEEGLNPVITNYSPYGIRLAERTFLIKHKLFMSGAIEVQDESSQLAGILLNPKRGEMVVDFCAGSGGKALLLGMMMHNTGRVYAFDVHERRLNNISERLKRSGLSNIYPVLLASEHDARVKRLYNKIDKVFVDAPCSGLGTLRRNPDLKFKNSKESIQELNAKQSSILQSASKLLKINGLLVYATCSILEEENQAIVAKFLQENPNFKLINAKNALSHLPHIEGIDDYLVLLPHIHHTDGFFGALLQRIA